MTRFMTHTIKRQFTRQLGTRLILDSQAKIIFLLSTKPLMRKVRTSRRHLLAEKRAIHGTLNIF